MAASGFRIQPAIGPAVVLGLAIAVSALHPSGGQLALLIISARSKHLAALELAGYIRLRKAMSGSVHHASVRWPRRPRPGPSPRIVGPEGPLP